MLFLSVCYRQTVHFERKEQKKEGKRERGKQRFYNTEKAVWEHLESSNVTEDCTATLTRLIQLSCAKRPEN